MAAGVVLALLVLGLVWGVLRLLRLLWSLLRAPRLVLPRLKGVRLNRTRALARAESARAAALALEVARLRVELMLVRQSLPEPRFLRAKREFARRFHPDRLQRRTPDRGLRIALFREYWAVLKQIEREG